jgi:hypothetical protein
MRNNYTIVGQFADFLRNMTSYSQYLSEEIGDGGEGLGAEGSITEFVSHYHLNSFKT